MNKNTLLANFLVAAMSAATLPAEQLVMETNASRLVVELKGGCITKFQSLTSGVNPLTWDSATGEDSQQDTARQRGHFICLDRWGPPSEKEAANGMPAHGEASRVNWNLSGKTTHEDGHLLAVMKADLPMANLEVRRSIRLDQDNNIFHVRESIRNTGKIGRIYNLLQHPTIAAPFLNEGTVVTCNATRGFPQSGMLPDPEAMAADWPEGLRPDGTVADISRLTDDAVPGVVSYVFEDEIGWIAAHDPVTNSVLGYIWKQHDYPWISLWRRTEGGSPAARGLEFGTTGLHRTYDELVRKGKIMNRPLFKHIDAGEIQTFGYICFLTKVPPGFSGVSDIRTDNGSIILMGANQSGHRIPVDIRLLR